MFKVLRHNIYEEQCAFIHSIRLIAKRLVRVRETFPPKRPELSEFECTSRNVCLLIKNKIESI
jgi:hypothetical protein